MRSGRSPGGGQEVSERLFVVFTFVSVRLPCCAPLGSLLPGPLARCRLAARGRSGEARGWLGLLPGLLPGLMLGLFSLILEQ